MQENTGKDLIYLHSLMKFSYMKHRKIIGELKIYQLMHLEPKCSLVRLISIEPGFMLMILVISLLNKYQTLNGGN